MRLGQLARKLSLRPSQIIDYLANHQIFPDEGSNAKLSDELTEQIIKKFAPEKLTEIMAMNMLVTEEDKATDLSQQQNQAEIDNESIDEPPSVAKPVTQVIEPLQTLHEDKAEVIKAPKVELTGLKVLGKIELKEAKKKEPEKTEEQIIEAGSTEQPRQKRERRDPKRERNAKDRPWRNPIQLQREREAREAEEKRKRQAEQEKEKRTQHYLKRIKSAAPPKPVKINDEPADDIAPAQQQTKPTTWLGRFWYWLNN